MSPNRKTAISALTDWPSSRIGGSSSARKVATADGAAGGIIIKLAGPNGLGGDRSSARAGALFEISLPVTVTNGVIDGRASRFRLGLRTIGTH